MNLFKCRHRVCIQCGVHFEPATGFEAQWGQLCSPHRQPFIKEYRRMGHFLEWAKKNIDKLEPAMREEEAEQLNAYGKLMKGSFSNAAFYQQQSAADAAAQSGLQKPQ